MQIPYVSTRYYPHIRDAGAKTDECYDGVVLRAVDTTEHNRVSVLDRPSPRLPLYMNRTTRYGVRFWLCPIRADESRQCAARIDEEGDC